MNASYGIFRKVMSIIFSVFALLWSVILFKAFMFNISRLNMDDIGIIGVADIPAAQFIPPRNLVLLFWIISIISFAVLNIVSAFKKSQSKALNILILILFGMMVCGIFLVPMQSYIISLYATFRRWFAKEDLAIQAFYFSSLVIAVLTGLSLFLSGDNHTVD